MEMGLHKATNDLHDANSMVKKHWTLLTTPSWETLSLFSRSSHFPGFHPTFLCVYSFSDSSKRSFSFTLSLRIPQDLILGPFLNLYLSLSEYNPMITLQLSSYASNAHICILAQTSFSSKSIYHTV